MTSPAQPQVTVVMPVTKSRFLAEAIESALGQDYANLEVLALNDGSKDPDLLPVLERYAASDPERFRFVSHENMGQSATINRGIELARGEIAGYLSDDDLLLPDAVRKQVNAMRSVPGAVVSYPSYEIVDESGQVIDTITPTAYSLVESVRLHDAIVGAGAFFSTAVFREIRGWDTTLRFRADYDFWLRMASEGTVVQVAEPLAAWRYHPAASTVAATGLQMSNESIRVLEKVYAADPLPDGLEEVRNQAFRNAFIQAAMVLTLGSNDPGERFFVDDRHMPKISRLAGEAGGNQSLLSGQVATLSEEVKALRGALAQRDEELALRSRPWWWKASRRLTPDALRPYAKRIGARLRPGRADS
jgi:hypothetical protein